MTTIRSTPYTDAAGPRVSALSAGTVHTCGLTSAGAAYCWGDNSTGELGNGSTTSSSIPVAVSGGQSFTALAAAGGFYAHTCGLTSGGAGFCWGYNYYGELGDGSSTDSSIPVAVSGGLSFSALAAGWSHTCG